MRAIALSFAFQVVVASALLTQSACADDQENASIDSTAEIQELQPAVSQQQSQSTQQEVLRNTDIKPIYKYVGNRFSLKFHRPSCPFARAMWRGNIIRFEYRKQAIDAGQKPCRYCLPPDWKTVGAKLLAKPSGQSSEKGIEEISDTTTDKSGSQVKKDVKESTSEDY